jgi:hypothetical protein
MKQDSSGDGAAVLVKVVDEAGASLDDEDGLSSLLALEGLRRGSFNSPVDFENLFPSRLSNEAARTWAAEILAVTSTQRIDGEGGVDIFRAASEAASGSDVAASLLLDGAASQSDAAWQIVGGGGGGGF